MRAGSSCSLCNSFIYPNTTVQCNVVGASQQCPLNVLDAWGKAGFPLPTSFRGG